MSIMPSEMQHAFTCPNQRQLHRVSLNIFNFDSNIQIKHHIRRENVWTNDAAQ